MIDPLAGGVAEDVEIELAKRIVMIGVTTGERRAETKAEPNQAALVRESIRSIRMTTLPKRMNDALDVAVDAGPKTKIAKKVADVLVVEVEEEAEREMTTATIVPTVIGNPGVTAVAIEAEIGSLPKTKSKSRVVRPVIGMTVTERMTIADHAKVVVDVDADGEDDRETKIERSRRRSMQIRIAISKSTWIWMSMTISMSVVCPAVAGNKRSRSVVKNVVDAARDLTANHVTKTITRNAQQNASLCRLGSKRSNV